LLRAHRLPQEREHDDDAREARHHQQDRRREREHVSRMTTCKAAGQVLAFGEIGNLLGGLVNGAAGVVEMAAAGVARGEWRIALVEPSGISPAFPARAHG